MTGKQEILKDFKIFLRLKINSNELSIHLFLKHSSTSELYFYHPKNMHQKL